MHNAEITAVILAGGRSTRMGRDKATLEVDGCTLFARTLAVLQPLFPRILIAGERPDLATPAVPCIPDTYPGSALGGLHSGLAAIAGEWMLVVPCDLAFPDARLVNMLLAQRTDCDAVVPRTPEGPEPVFALYHRNCLPLMEAMLQAGAYRIRDLLPQLRVRYLDLDGAFPWRRALLNLNTPQDLADLKEHAE